jgi:hypothetical protein
VLEVLPAALGLFAASEIGIAEALNSVVSRRVATASISFRFRFMGPPGPLLRVITENCEGVNPPDQGGFPEPILRTCMSTPSATRD